jgi:hypothetical protein
MIISESDKLHLKFCKFIFGVHKKSSDFAAMSELGRFPFDIINPAPHKIILA